MNSAHQNIEAVARLEREFLEKRTGADRLGDWVANFAGSMKFVLVHVLGFIAWVLVNAGWVRAIPPFDPFPYVLLTMTVSMEAVLIATFVLMKQNRMSRRADQRDHLNLQIDLLAEKEITKILQLTQLLCDHFSIQKARQDSEVEELSQNTAVERLAKDLRDRIPAE
jgi:uncharacterized membrane protein